MNTYYYDYLTKMGGFVGYRCGGKVYKAKMISDARNEDFMATFVIEYNDPNEMSHKVTIIGTERLELLSSAFPGQPKGE